jgi:RNA polymerase sigma-70 factor, ECF subfamily
MGETWLSSHQEPLQRRERPRLVNQRGIDSEDDATLVGWAKQGNKDALNELCYRYLDPIFRYCMSRIGDVHAAEDVTSKVFFKVMNKLPSVEDDNRFRGWIYRIAETTVLDHFRKVNIRQRREIQIDEAETRGLEETIPDPSAEAEIEDIVVLDERHQRLHRCKSELNPRELRVIELDLEGTSGAEIASFLGINEGAVKMRRSRAVKKLRRCMSGSEGES